MIKEIFAANVPMQQEGAEPGYCYCWCDNSTLGWFETEVIVYLFYPE